MIDNENPRDDAVEKELAGVPEDMLDKEQDGPGEETLDLNESLADSSIEFVPGLRKLTPLIGSDKSVCARGK